MATIDFEKLTDLQLNNLINNRWKSSEILWDVVQRIYKQNTAIYENKSKWMDSVPYARKNYVVQANRIFVDMESVINSLIANPPGINILPARKGEDAQLFASRLENYLRKKFNDLNFKETTRMALRNLYFGRFLCIKAFWNPTLGYGGDFDFRAIDPRNIRVGKYARKEIDSEFVIEEIEDNLCSIIERFPKKKEELMAKYGIVDDDDLYIKNPDVKYKEAWIQDYVIFKLDNIILDKIKNPYWDYDGILVTEDEEAKLNGNGQVEPLTPDQRRQMLSQIKLAQGQRTQKPEEVEPAGNFVDETQQTQPQGQPTPGGAYGEIQTPQGQPQDPNQQPQQPQMDDDGTPVVNTPTPEKYKPYFFNYFDSPRKPYIFTTIFNNENTPIGRTDMITLSADLQRGIDKRKMDIDENCELVNGIIKVDAGVMGKSDAQRIRFETKGIIWGKGVKDGVTRETGTPLPAMVFQDMEDSRSEIDNIMAASSAFRGQQQGVETKAGRLALIQQSALRLNELVQVVDYVSKESFDWAMQLSKTRYTEYHYAKSMGKDVAHEVIEIIQDDFETGIEVAVVAGKTLPVDDEFKFEQAQQDYKEGALSLPDYLRISKYDDPKQIAKNAVLWKISPISQIGLTDEERKAIPPPLPVTQLRETIAFHDIPASAKPQWLARMGIQVDPNETLPNSPETITMAFKDLPPDAQVQALARIGIKSDPNVLVAEKIAEHEKSKKELAIKEQSSLPTEPAPVQ